MSPAKMAMADMVTMETQGGNGVHEKGERNQQGGRQGGAQAGNRADEEAVEGTEQR